MGQTRFLLFYNKNLELSIANFAIFSTSQISFGWVNNQLFLNS